MRRGGTDHGAPGTVQLLGAAWSALRLGLRAGPYRLAAHSVVTVLAALVPVVSVWALRDLLDALTAGAPTRAAGSAVVLAATGLVAAVVPAMGAFLQNELSRSVGRRAQSDLYLATARLAGLARLEEPAFRDRLRLAQSAGRAGPGQVVGGLLGTAQLTISLFGLVAILASVGPLFAAIVVVGLVPALVVEVRLSSARAQMLWRVSPHERRELFYADLQTSLPAAKEFRLLGLSELFRQRMLRELGAADEERRRMDVRELRTQAGLGALSALVLAGLVLWSARAATRGDLSVGDVSALVGATMALQTMLASLVSRIALIHHSLLMFSYFQEILAAEPDLPAPAGAAPAPPLRRQIELRDVWFRYGPAQPWVLRGVSLVIPQGASVALVGLNGAGKSTLIKLLCRFYDPQRGAVLWDGIDLRELDVTTLRERVGALFQDYMSYELSAMENIGLGDVAALTDDERIQAAAERAGIAGAIAALPDGYQTMLSRSFVDVPEGGDGRAGVLLSGGQWQRLALARTFLRDQRDLLILDEPNSGLDAEAEHEIHEGLRRHRRGATSVLVSHRLSAVREADLIVVLANGQVVEQGSHERLLADGGPYARLFHLQAKGYRAEVGRAEVDRAADQAPVA